MTDSLWGPEFDLIDSKTKASEIIKKTKQPKTPKIVESKNINSKKLSLQEKLTLITERVNNILGKQKNNVQVITTLSDLEDYITKSIEAGILAVDTETNNSLDPVTCKLMGLCLYSPGQKQAYVPVNHINYETGEKLTNQLTEMDIANQLERVKNIKLIFHNYKFDYQVIKCTCNVELPVYWDTEIAARLINENEPAGLKYQYVTHIDTEQEKYSIDDLFDKQEYSIFPPEVFALYAATDSLMTYKLYMYQKPIMEDFRNHPGPFGESIYDLFFNTELPCVVVTANMELNGVEVDLDYAERLSAKYHKQLEDIDTKIAEEVNKLKPQIDSWKLTSEANIKPKKVGKNGEESEGKSKAEQLDDPINLGSPTQMAILFYDILKSPVVNTKSPRSTDEDSLKSIYNKTKNPLCGILLERRACLKLLTTYIDNIPELAKIWEDHRLRSHFNQLGTDTGRFSSGGKIKYRDTNGNPVEVSGINYQNIPSHNKEIRLLFKAKEDYHNIELIDNYYEVKIGDEILTPAGWKNVKEINIGDTICGDNTNEVVVNKLIKQNTIILYV